MGTGVTQRAHDGLPDGHLRTQGFAVDRVAPARGEHDHLGRAECDGRQQDVQADGGDVPRLERQRAGRQSACRGRGGSEHFPRFAAVVEDDAGVRAAGVAIGGEQLLHLRAAMGDAGILVRHRARRAHGGAGAATHAQVRLDRDVVAVGSDRPGGADLDARVAALYVGAAVGAELLAVGEVLGLLELPDRFAQLRHDRSRVRSRRDMVIALGRLAHREQRRGGEIQDEVEARRRGRTRGRRVGGGEIGDGGGEFTEVARQGLDAPGPSGESRAGADRRDRGA